MAATIPSPNAVVYLNRIFESATSPYQDTNEQIAQELAASGFTTVILFSLQVSLANCGDITFSGPSPIASGGQFDPDSAFGYLPPLVQELTGSGSSITNVLFSIASGWDNINSLLNDSSDPASSTLIQNFQAIQNALGIDGFDFDNEDAAPSVCVPMTGLLSNGGDNIISWSPYTDQSDWVSALASVYSQNNSTQLVSWLNLQCYGGGTGNQPSDWISAITGSSGNQTGLSAAQAQAFIIPGFDPITSLANNLAALAGQTPYPTTVSPLAGAFYWGGYDIFSADRNPCYFAQAILSATGGG